MKILVTGFKPFGGERINPSEEVVRRLPAALGGVELVSLILPVERRESVAQAAQAIRTHRPQAVVSIGQAGGRSAVTVERVAINLDDFSIPDQKGEQPRGSRWRRRDRTPTCAVCRWRRWWGPSVPGGCPPPFP